MGRARRIYSVPGLIISAFIDGTTSSRQSAVALSHDATGNGGGHGHIEFHGPSNGRAGVTVRPDAGRRSCVQRNEQDQDRGAPPERRTSPRSGLGGAPSCSGIACGPSLLACPPPDEPFAREAGLGRGRATGARSCCAAKSSQHKLARQSNAPAQGGIYKQPVPTAAGISTTVATVN